MRTVILVGLAALMSGCGSKKQDYSVPGLIKSLEDKDPDTRITAATVLGKYTDQPAEVVPALTGALKDSDKHVRKAAAYSLAQFGREARDALPTLQEALKDQEDSVRQAAAYAIREIQNPGKNKGADKKKKG